MFSKTFSVYVVMILFDVTHAQSNVVTFRNDYNYIESEKSFYKFHKVAKNWRDAKQTCALEGSSLFYPENSDEAQTVVSLWKLYEYSAKPDDTWIFVGMSDIITEGVYETIDGKPISKVYGQWAPNQPDNSGDEDCIHLNQVGNINDIKCNAEYNFICKKGLLSLEQNCSCNIEESKYDEQRAKKFFRKDYTYVEAAESFYKIHATPRSWEDAKRMCALEAATFYYPENADESSAVASFWDKTKPNIESVWIGLSDIFVEGVFETADGKSISDMYANWWGGEPNNFGDREDCVTIDLKDQKMNDYICDVNLYFICKKSLKTLEWNNNCNMPYLDYNLNKDTGKCYKLHTTPLTWTEAYAMCQLEESTLAVVSNRREAAYLVKLTESTPKPRVEGKYQRGIYHMGFHNRLNKGWQTVKGTPFKVDNVNTWFDNYQPDGEEECGSMFYTGRLINTDCDMKSFFICEHEVNS